MLGVTAGLRRAALASTLVLGVLAFGCQGDPDAPGIVGPEAADPVTSGAYEPTDADFAAIARTLASRARAIERNDRSAFLATIDPGNEWLRRSQLELFENLQELPLRSIRYDPDDFGDAGEAVAGDDPTARPDIVEVVRLAGVDRTAIANDVDMTFVRRDGQWLLGLETVLHDRLDWDTSVSRPWFGNRIDAERRGSMLVVTDRQSPPVADSLADRCAAHLADIASFLRVPQDHQLLVDATSTGRTLEINTEGGEAAAVLFPVFAPDGRRLAGWRVKVNPNSVEEFATNESLLRHELTHFIAKDLLRIGPTWLSEGIAEYVGYLPVRLPDLRYSAHWAEMLREATPEIPGSGRFLEKPEVSYPAAHATVTVLMELRGIDGIHELVRAYRRAARSTTDTYADWATPMVIRRVYGLSQRELTRRAWELLDSSLGN